MALRKSRFHWLALLLVLALVPIVAACGATTPQTVEKQVPVTVEVPKEVIKEVPVPVTVAPAPQPAANEIVVYHWWTAGGERQAMDKIFEWYNKKNPDTKVVDNPIAGGGGVTLKTVLLGLLAAGIPPDTFQSLSGAELKMYVDGNYVDPVDDVWQAQNLDTNYPKVIGKMTTFNGKHYGIPMNAHRANWLFYNKPLFDELKLTPPTTIDEMISVAKTIKAQKPDVTPIGIGTREKWPTVFLFDVTLLSTGGPDVYEKFYTGQLDVKQDPAIRTALEKYKELIPYLYEFHGAKTWSDIAGPVGEGKIGMMVIGDFAAGLLTQANFSDFQDILTRFLYSPDVDRALEEINTSMTLYKVADASQWYWAK